MIKKWTNVVIYSRKNVPNKDLWQFLAIYEICCRILKSNVWNEKWVMALTTLWEESGSVMIVHGWISNEPGSEAWDFFTLCGRSLVGLGSSPVALSFCPVRWEGSWDIRGHGGRRWRDHMVSWVSSAKTPLSSWQEATGDNWQMFEAADSSASELVAVLPLSELL